MREPTPWRHASRGAPASVADKRRRSEVPDSLPGLQIESGARISEACARRGLDKKAKAAPIPGGLRLRPQDHAAPTPRGCGAEPELLQEPPIAVLSLFKGLAVASGENSRLPRRAIDTVHGLYLLGSKFGRSGVMFSICTRISDNPQEDAAENFAEARSSVPARARFLRWAPPLPQASATASSSGRTARIAARGIRETAIGNRKFFRVNRELIRENRQSGATEQRSPHPFGLAARPSRAARSADPRRRGARPR